MGSDKTDTTQPLSGILIPYDVTNSGTLGTDYTVADKEITGFTTDGDTTLAVIAEGDTTATSNVTLQVAKAGPLGPLGGGFAYTDTAGTYGREGPWLLNGYQWTDQTAKGGIDALDVCELYDSTGQLDGRIACVFIDSSNDPQVMIRAADGSWGSASDPTSISTALGAAVAPGRDGSIWLYVVALRGGSQTSSEYTVHVYRYDGTSWTQQTPDAFPNGEDLGSGVRRLALERAPDGETVMFSTTGTGTASATRQFRSAGGVAFTEVGSSTSRKTVWDVRWRGTFHVLTVEQDDGSDDPLLYRRIASAGEEL